MVGGKWVKWPLRRGALGSYDNLFEFVSIKNLCFTDWDTLTPDMTRHSRTCTNSHPRLVQSSSSPVTCLSLTELSSLEIPIRESVN